MNNIHIKFTIVWGCKFYNHPYIILTTELNTVIDTLPPHYVLTVLTGNSPYTTYKMPKNFYWKLADVSLVAQLLEVHFLTPQNLVIRT